VDRKTNPPLQSARAPPSRRRFIGIRTLLPLRDSPELNRTEECWRRLDRVLGNCLFGTLDELREAALTALDDIEPPNVFMYLYRRVSMWGH